MASIVGKCLLDSGAADRIVRSALRVVGERGAPLAFVGSRFLLGIPVFFDTVFYLMMPPGKALHPRTGRDYLLYVLSIVAGATMAHSLVPPTPGPLYAAAELKVDMGLMILVGCGVGMCSAMAGYLFASTLTRFWQVPMRKTPDLSPESLRELASRPESDLPPLWISLLPILLPVVLIGGQAMFKKDAESSQAWIFFVDSLNALGDKNLAMSMAAIIAILTFVWKRRPTLIQLADGMQAALSSAGIIILITAAGGAFGAMLKQTGVAELLDALPKTSTVSMLVLAFLVTAAVRTAQGSATVAMITATGILGPIALSGELACHPVWVAMAIGCGSKPCLG